VRLLVIAVGQRQPARAESAWADYARRFPSELRLELEAVKTEPRLGGKPVAALKAAEAQRIAAALPRGARRGVLDERGLRASTAELAARLAGCWRAEGRDVALLVGGPDGLADEPRSGADETLRLSDLTLPHALARVLLAEALYRAWSLLVGRPYRRE